MRFWDSSAVVARLVGEDSTRALDLLLREDPSLIVWWGTRVECAAALARGIRERRLSGSAFSAAWARMEAIEREASVVQPSADVRERAIRLVRSHALRAADAFQLAAALLWAEEKPAGRGFVCLDVRLRTAAGREGFDVQPE